MKIGVIGGGSLGGALAGQLSKLGHTVLLANSRGPDSLVERAAELGAQAVAVTDAAKGVDLVIVTIPLGNIPHLPGGLFSELAADVPVIDTCNYHPGRDSTIPELEAGTVESVWVAQQLKHPVVKVFNNVPAKTLTESGVPAGTPGRIALPVAGDNPRTKAIVLGLVDALGFDGVDAGSLDESWRQGPGTPVYATDLDADGVRHGLASADLALSHERRGRVMEVFLKLLPTATTKDMALAIRAVP